MYSDCLARTVSSTEGRYLAAGAYLGLRWPPHHTTLKGYLKGLASERGANKEESERRKATSQCFVCVWLHEYRKGVITDIRKAYYICKRRVGESKHSKAKHYECGKKGYILVHSIPVQKSNPIQSNPIHPSHLTALNSCSYFLPRFRCSLCSPQIKISP